MAEKHIISGSVIDDDHPLATESQGDSEVNTIPTTGVNTLAAKTVPTVAAETIGAATAATRGVLVQALSTNDAAVYVGGATVVVASGIELWNGDSVYLPVDNVADIYCISGSAAQELRVLGV